MTGTAPQIRPFDIVGLFGVVNVDYGCRVILHAAVFAFAFGFLVLSSYPIYRALISTSSHQSNIKPIRYIIYIYIYILSSNGVHCLHSLRQGLYSYGSSAIWVCRDVHNCGVLSQTRHESLHPRRLPEHLCHCLHGSICLLV